MSDHEKFHGMHGGVARAMVAAINAVVAAGICMQIVAVAMLAIPNLSFDVSNPSVLNPTYFLALIIIGIGVGITLAGARLAIKIAKRAWDRISSCPGAPPAAGIQGAPRGAVGAGPNVIRPALVKKEVSEPSTAPKAEIRPQVAPAAQSKPAAPAPVEVPLSSGPADMASLTAALNQITDRYNNPDVRSKFEGWVNNLVMAFPDINKAYTIKINGSEGINMSDGSDDSAAIQVTMASDMFVKLLSKQINAIKAYSSGALKVKGEMKNLLKLRKLMF